MTKKYAIFNLQEGQASKKEVLELAILEVRVKAFLSQFRIANYLR